MQREKNQPNLIRPRSRSTPIRSLFRICLDEVIYEGYIEGIQSQTMWFDPLDIVKIWQSMKKVI